jgi:D-cysteine desulfhydrase family pyridoxal phosphate-dependent enzyme
MMNQEELRRQLQQLPRLPYYLAPSPLYPLPRLNKVLTRAAPEIWIKRDDELGPAFGGNKGRKLAYIMADVLIQGKRKVITYGGLQSNHARMTAAACAALGLEAHLFFFARKPPQLTGNLLLNQLLGARMHFIPVGGGGDAFLTLEATNRLVQLVARPRTGRSAYFMPVGGHNVTGCLGYVEAACEIHEQVQSQNLPPEKITILTAAGTGGTLAGLMAGFALLNSPIRVLGIDIGKLWKRFPQSIARLANELIKTLHGKKRFAIDDVPLIERTYAGPAYAQPHPPAIEAIRLLARQEGILLDPVYTGKAFAGLINLVAHGRFTAGDILIFLHTGGFPSLWAYADSLL